jgi:hypothetical protein
MPTTGGGRVDPAKEIQKKKKKQTTTKVGLEKNPWGGATEPVGSNQQTGSLDQIIYGSEGSQGDGNYGVAAASVPGSGDYATGTGGTNTQFGNAFLPGMYGEAWANPDTLIREKFRQEGIGTRGGTYAALLDQADNLGIMWMLMQGNQAAQGTPNFIDWSGQYLDNQLTPGGRSVSAADIAGALRGAIDDPNNPTRNYLANPGLTPSDQVGNVLSTLNKSFEGANMPDIIRAAYLARARELGDSFQNQRMRQPMSDPFLNTLDKTGFLGSLGG